MAGTEGASDSKGSERSGSAADRASDNGAVADAGARAAEAVAGASVRDAMTGQAAGALQGAANTLDPNDDPDTVDRATNGLDSFEDTPESRAVAANAEAAKDRAAMDRTREAAREALGLTSETEIATPETYADSYASQTLSGINEGVANVLGGPVDLAAAGLNGLSSLAGWAGAPDEYTPEFSGAFLGSEHIKGMMSGMGSITPESADPTKQTVREAAEFATEIGSAFAGMGAARLSGYSMQADEAIESVADFSPASVDLALSYKPGWSDMQRAAADGKVQALTNADTVVTEALRSSTSARRRFTAELGPVPARMDVDHTHDLQLGGADDILNMSPLDSSVNRSLGAQIQHRIKDLPIGTPVDRVTIGER